MTIKYKENENAVISIDQTDFFDYVKQVKTGSVSKNLKDYIRSKMNPQIPPHQDFDLEVTMTEDARDYRDTTAVAEGEFAAIESAIKHDCSGLNLSGTTFIGNVPDFSFKGADLSGCTFRCGEKGRLVTADFDGTTLSGAVFDAVNVSGSTFSNLVIADQEPTFNSVFMDQEQAKALKLSIKTMLDLTNFTKSDLEKVTEKASDEDLDKAIQFCRLQLQQGSSDAEMRLNLDRLSEYQLEKIRYGVQSVLAGEGVQQSWWKWAKAFVADTRSDKERIQKYVSDNVVDVLRKDAGFREGFLLSQDKIGELVGKCVSEFVVPRMEEILSRTEKGSEERNSALLRFEADGQAEIKSRVESWITEQSNSWDSRAAQLKIAAKSNIQPQKGHSVGEQILGYITYIPSALISRGIPDSWNSDKRSSYPTPSIAAETRRDELQAKGRNLTTALAAVSASTLTYSGTGSRSMAAVSGLSTGAAMYLSGMSHNASGQLGDRLLELGMIQEIIESNTKNLGPAAAAIVATQAMQRYTGMGGAVGAVAVTGLTAKVLDDIYALIKTLDAEKSKTNFMERKRPGTKEFAEAVKGHSIIEKVKNYAKWIVPVVAAVASAYYFLPVVYATTITLGVSGGAYGIKKLMGSRTERVSAGSSAGRAPGRGARKQVRGRSPTQHAETERRRSASQEEKKQI